MTRPKILVVDDEPGMLRAVERVLAPTYDVRTARLPHQAIDAATAERFAIALLDVRMPEMDGFELMARLQAIQGDLDVILMTGSTDERDARLTRAIREKAFFFLTKPFDREVLLTLVERCVELRRLDADNRDHLRRLERELEAARIFQHSLLPLRNAACAGLEIAFEYEPCAELGGDFCDYRLADGEPCAVLVSDVAGHGAPAAMLTGMIKQIFRGAPPTEFSPGAVLQRILAASRLIQYDRHLTAICALIHPGSRTIEYANAGHPPGLLVHPDGPVTRLDSSAPLIHPGLPEWHCEQRVLATRPGDRLLFYTDGLTEARNAADEEFGDERVERVIARRVAEARGGDARPASLLRALRDELDAFRAGRPLEDDLTLVLVHRV